MSADAADDAADDTSDDADNLCVICLEPVADSADATALSCAHVYHRACIGRWLKCAARCPQCGTAAGQLVAVGNTGGGSGLNGRLQSAEAQLLAARRINRLAVQQLEVVLDRQGSSDAQGLASQFMLKLGEAEAAVHAAGAQLTALEAQLGPAGPRPSPRSPYAAAIAQSPYNSPRASAHQRRPGERPSEPSAVRLAERQHRTAAQQVRAQLRVAQRESPRVVRPSRR